jgi:transposase
MNELVNVVGDPRQRDEWDDVRYECLSCGDDIHADYNAAKNIGLKYLRDQQKSGRGGAPVGVRLNSGMLNVNGEYSPTVING